MKTRRFKTRDRVRFVPVEACGDFDANCCSDGTISRLEPRRVMVKFDVSVALYGWDGATEVACNPSYLHVVRAEWRDQ